jgi:Flp pilus assembly protein TadB
LPADRAAALLALAAALALWPPAVPALRRRVGRLLRSRSVPSLRATAGTAGLSAVARRRLLAVAAGAAAGLFLGLPWGASVGVAIAVAVDRVLRRAPGHGARRTEARLLAELPTLCDLLAVCLEAGVPPAAAVGGVADAVAEPVRGELRRVAGMYRLGADPARAWSDLPAPLAGLGRAFVRAGTSGSSVVPALRALSAEARFDARSRTEAAVRRAGVWVLAPLGACFLPAFLCLGVVPMVLGIARSVFG